MKKFILLSFAILCVCCWSLALADVSSLGQRPGATTSQVFVDDSKTPATPENIAITETPVVNPVVSISNRAPISQKRLDLMQGKPVYTPPPPDQNIILQGGDNVGNATAISALPYSNTGTTIGYANDYDSDLFACFATSTSPDVVYSFTPSSSVIADVSLCTNSAYDTKVFIFENAAGNVVACHDDDCSTPSYPSAYVSQIPSFNFLAGNTYYIVIDGYGGDAGTYTIDVTPVGACVPDFIVTAPGSWSGTTTGAGDDCGLRIGEDHIYQVNIPYEADWEFSFCGGPVSWDAVMYLGSACCVGDLGYSDDECTGANETMPVIAAHLTAGSYFVDFEPYSSINSGQYTLTVSEVVPCVVTCPPGGINETEDNGGCNSVPPVFNYIAPGQTICGMGWEDASLRDTDWYLFNLTGDSIVTLTMTAAFNYVFGIIVPFSADPCDNSGSLTYYAVGGPCDTMTVQALLGATPGVYVAFVAPISGIFTDLPYWMSMTAATPPPPPVNNDCASVTPQSLAPATPLTFVGNNEWATNDCAIGGFPDVWQAFTTTEVLHVTIDFCTTAPAFNTVSTFLTECPCASQLFSTTVNWATCGDGNASIRWEFLPPGTYYYPIYSGSGAMGNYTSHVTGIVPPPPPANDDCVNAILVGVPSATLGTTISSTIDPVPTCGTSITTGGVWYNVVGTGNTMTATTCDLLTDYDSKISVYCNTCETPVCVVGNDDDCVLPSHGLNSTVTWCSAPGTTYRILVHGFSSNTGNFNLLLSDDGTPCSNPPSCVPPPNDNCADVTPQSLIPGTPLVFTGNNGGATLECGISGYAEVWIAFTTTECQDVTINSCGTSPFLDWVGNWMFSTCPCGDYVANNGVNWVDCGDGNWSMIFNYLPAGTWYYPLLSDPGYNPTGPYTVNVSGAVCSLPVFGVNPTSVTGNAPSGGSDSQLLVVSNTGNVTLTADISITIDPPPPLASLPQIGNPTAMFNNQKAEYIITPPPPDENLILQGGDSISQATVIASLPYNDAGTTAGYTNDYDEVCPYTGSTSPDVVYSWVATADTIVDFNLCNGSSYDTKLYLYENAYTPDNPFACNDDACPGYYSQLLALPVTSGNTYYIVVDGYGGASGNYVLDVSFAIPPPPPPGCPAEGVLYGANPTLSTEGWNFLTSDTEPAPAGYTVFENFAGIFGTIEEIKFWGIDAFNGGSWVECDAATEDFVIGFYPDNGGLPGPDVALYNVTVTPTATGGNFSGFVQKEYVATLNPPLTLSAGWISIQAVTSGDNCWFLWQNSVLGNDANGLQFDGTNYNATLTDLAICMMGTYVAPWLGTDVNYIEVPSGGQANVNVGMSGANLNDGTYTGSVVFNTNEVMALVHIVPVVFNVGAAGCVYVPGDINGNGSANGIDVTYGVAFFKGGSVPPIDCNPPCVGVADPFYAAGDVNGNCAFNGIDITFYVAYLKGLQPALRNCDTCPPAGLAAPGPGQDSPAVVPIKRAVSNQQ
jgi:hypothetical protein